jgi:hypothetical protein
MAAEFSFKDITASEVQIVREHLKTLLAQDICNIS